MVAVVALVSTPVGIDGGGGGGGDDDNDDDDFAADSAADDGNDDNDVGGGDCDDRRWSTSTAWATCTATSSRRTSWCTKAAT